MFLLASTLALPMLGFAQESQSSQIAPDSVITTEVINPNKYTVETNTFGHNWFIGLGAGSQMYFGDHSKQMKIQDRPSLYGEFDFGKWFTPGLGLRVSVGGGISKGVSAWTAHEVYAHPNENWNNYKGFIVYENNLTPQVYKNGNAGYPIYNTREQWMNIGGEALFNLSNLIWGYNEERVYSFIPYAGVGFAFSLNPAYRYIYESKMKSPNGEYSNVVSASVGLLNRFRISNHFDINVDIRGLYVGETFDQQFGGTRNGYYIGVLGNNWGEGLLTANIGLAYNINPGWEKAKRTTIRVNENVLEDLRGRLSDAEKRNVELRQQLEEALNREVTQENVAAQPLLVTFKIDHWDLSKKDRVNLGFLAKTIKANPNMVYTVVGYADKGTGSVKRNIFLAQKRSEVVYNCLVNEFGVSESQLRRSSEGGVGNMYYNDPRLSRAVLTQVVAETK